MYNESLAHFSDSLATIAHVEFNMSKIVLHSSSLAWFVSLPSVYKTLPRVLYPLEGQGSQTFEAALVIVER